MRANIGLFVVVALAVVAIWKVWPRERLLMELAHPIVKVDAEQTAICWLSVHQLLIVTNAEPAAVGNRNGAPNLAHWQGSVDILNITTHNRSHLTALANLFQPEMTVPLTVPESLETSPDGLWLRWDTHAARGSWFMGGVARLDGTHYREWDRNRPNGVPKIEEDFFLDSSHLVQMADQGSMMTVLDLKDPSKDQVCRELEQADAVLTQYARQQPVFDPEPEPGDGYVEVDTYRTQDRMKLILSQGVPSRGAPSPLQTRKVALPDGAVFCESKVAPQQCIAYHLEISRTPPLLSWLHRMIPKFTSKPMIIEELWVSRADGSGMHKIGGVPIKWDANGKAEDPPDGFEYFINDIQWLPDGKQISFVYNGTLYVVPATP